MLRFGSSRVLLLASGWLAVLLVLGWWAGTSLPGPQAALAQVEAVDGGADAGAADAGDGAPAPPTQQSYLSFFFQALGIKYTIAFLILSFVFVSFLVMNLLGSRRDAICPKHLADSFEAQVNERKFQEAYELAKNDDSMLGRVLASGMANLQQGYDKAVEAMQTTGEEETMKLDQRLSIVALCGTISPMLGLLGTVDGMVASFMVIANSATTPKPAELAAGISMALVTTLVGLWLAIPAIIAFNLLKNRLAKLQLEVGGQVEAVFSRFQTMGKK